jgi:hypothetical protein
MINDKIGKMPQHLIDELRTAYARATAPITLALPSGHWISAREAKATVERLTGIKGNQAVGAICRRAVTAVPVQASTFSRGESPHEDLAQRGILPRLKNDLSHFQSSRTPNDLSEILDFFALIGGALDGPPGEIGHAVWSLGDFEVTLERSISDVTLTIVGLQFDQEALLASLGEKPQKGETRLITAAAKNAGGRPPKYDWEGAIIHIAAVANGLDGLPSGSGAQTEIADLVADWFVNACGECPADSEVRRRAARIMQALSAR